MTKDGVVHFSQKFSAILFLPFVDAISRRKPKSKERRKNKGKKRRENKKVTGQPPSPQTSFSGIERKKMERAE